jgi:NADH:ubiquinone oxidoreductase subunit 5 (subunit L)/multisubunit Na+/H+ antiporter MnhA subunit
VGVAIFHLIGHSFFKALLFLGAGSIIHAVNTNDLREMGGVGKYMKWTMYTMLIGSLSLAGFPYFTGFFSKDEVILIAYEYGVLINYLPYVFLIFAAILTAIYTFRMWFSVFTGKERSNYAKHESPGLCSGRSSFWPYLPLDSDWRLKVISTNILTPTSSITISTL